MKTELPAESKKHKKTIHNIKDIILKHSGEKIAFIILFGSFARGNWVLDRYQEDGILYEYASDYDFFIVTKNNKNGNGYLAIRLKDELYDKLKRYHRPYKSHTPTLVIEPINRINDELERGQYFFTDIKKEGVLLYDSGDFALAEERELSTDEQKKIAEHYYEYWFNKGEDFLIDCKNALERNSNNNSVFYLHQSTESFLNCTMLVLTGYKAKIHDLKELVSLAASQDDKFLTIFPLANEEQEECFRLLQNAYIDARYSIYYSITKTQLQYLISRVEKLNILTKQICQSKINSLK